MRHQQAAPADSASNRGFGAAETHVLPLGPCHRQVAELSSHIDTDSDIQPNPRTTARRPLYTPEERIRRDATRWTLVQGILAPVQFLVFLVSLVLVLRYLHTGEGLAVATLSVVVKTLVLYAIMITGAIWERVVFGRYLFARPFFWEDVFSILVLALHTAYLAALAVGWGDGRDQMLLALAAYATYVINATQFLLKLRAARLDQMRHAPPPAALGLAQ